MDCYDTVMVECPKCRKSHEAQSKGGKCLLKVWSLDAAPEDVMSDVNRHAPFGCECGCMFVVSGRRVFAIADPDVVKRLKYAEAVVAAVRPVMTPEDLIPKLRGMSLQEVETLAREHALAVKKAVEEFDAFAVQCRMRS